MTVWGSMSAARATERFDRPLQGSLSLPESRIPGRFRLRLVVVRLVAAAAAGVVGPQSCIEGLF